MMGLWHMFSLPTGRTSGFQCLRSLLKGKLPLQKEGNWLICRRWIFYSAVNSVTPLIVLNLGFESSAWKISIRQLSYTLPTLFASIPITLYSTWKKDLKSHLLVTFAFFLVVYVSTPLS